MPLTFNLKQRPPQSLTSVNDVMEFGKHKGIIVEQILHDEPEYLDWLLDKKLVTMTDEILTLVYENIFDRNRQDGLDEIGFLDDIPF